MPIVRLYILIFSFHMFFGLPADGLTHLEKMWILLHNKYKSENWLGLTERSGSTDRRWEPALFLIVHYNNIFKIFLEKNF